MPEFLGRPYTTEIMIPASMDDAAIRDLVKDTMKKPEDVNPVVILAIAASRQLKAVKCKMYKTIAPSSEGNVLIAVHV